MAKNSYSLSQSFSICFITYLLAIAVAFYVGGYFPEVSYLEKVAYGDIAGTLVVFAASILFKNASLYDAYWSVKPPIIAVFYTLYPETATVDIIRVILLNLAIWGWGIRLTWNWARKWEGLSHQDWRYVDLKNKSGVWYPLVNFFGIHFFPTLLVYLSCLPMYPAMNVLSAPIGLYDIIGIVLCFIGIGFELVADNQLRAFTLDPNRKPGTTLQTGLWKYSRHPNYFGEVTFWWGIFFFTMSNGDFIWTIAGPISITVLFVFISIPMIDKRMMERRVDYTDYKKNVSALVPWFVKKA